MMFASIHVGIVVVVVIVVVAVGPAEQERGSHLIYIETAMGCLKVKSCVVNRERCNRRAGELEARSLMEVALGQGFAEFS